MRELLLSVFHGCSATWPVSEDPARFLAYTLEQGIQPLLRELLNASGTAGQWPVEVLDELLRETGREMARDMHVARELPRVLEALSGAGVRALLTKGTPLSFTHYPAPGLRPRADTDLLIRRADLPAVAGVLSAMGYAPGNAVTGDYISHQSCYAGPIALDVHWKVLNPVMFCDVLSFEEMDPQAVAILKLGPRARTPCPAHALLLSCVHRVAHHGHNHSDRLIWLYDIHLLVQNMNAAEFEAFARIAAERRVRTLCLAGIEAAHEWFGTNLFEEISRRVLQVPDAASEPSAGYLQPGLSRFGLMRLDMQQLSGRDRLRLLREHLFPSAGYMLRKYNTERRLLLPALYLHRAITGAWKGFTAETRR